jgi:hypothetical protein
MKHKSSLENYQKSIIIIVIWKKVQVKVKVKFALEQARKAQTGSRNTDLLFL